MTARVLSDSCGTPRSENILRKTHAWDSALNTARPPTDRVEGAGVGRNNIA